ncbi:MAG: glycosyltransferase family 25 protein [Xanthobacteraceae bacterium]|nr:glycosyltransferase family 25 protein [Xanthobacteraceae bacterium]
MRVHVINLAAAVERLAHMTRVLGAAGIAFERFDAIDAVSARSHRCFARIPPMAERGWAPAEIGCLLSHYEVWHRIASGGDPFAAVLEDDLFVDPALEPLLDGRRQIPGDADLIKLETTGIEVSLSRIARCCGAGIGFHRLRSLHHGSGAYLLSRRAAGILIDRIEAFDAPVDDALFSPAHPIGGSLRAYQVVPALAVQGVILAPTGHAPALASGIERVRTVARDLHAAMAQSGHGLPGGAAAPARSRDGMSAAAVARRLRSLRKWLLERRMVVPYGLISQPSPLHETSMAGEGAGG